MNNPYNFVPFKREQIYYPDWGAFINQVIPFQDGESGVLSLSLKTHSPLFIRNGSLAKIEIDDKGKPYLKPSEEGFCIRNKDKYFIPASSIKGMLRNVLEIISFSKMNFVNPDVYSVRDLTFSDNFYLREVQSKPILCGLLRRRQNGQETIYEVEHRGEPLKLSHQAIKEHFGDKGRAFYNFFYGKDGFKGSEQREKTAAFKYEKYPIEGSALVEQEADFLCLGKNNYRPLKDEDYENPELADKVIGGRIVFTGQPHMGTKHKAKEFIFESPKTKQKKIISEQVFEQFRRAYYEYRPHLQSDDYKMAMSRLKDKKSVPIFFQEDENGNILHFGLSYLYKITYKYGVEDFVKSPDANLLDLSECIFGRIEEAEDKNRTFALKGRVHIGHADLVSKPSFLEEKQTILASPKASFYPFYMAQFLDPKFRRNKKPGNKYATMMDSPDKTSIAGWKRYPVVSSKDAKQDYRRYTNTENQAISIKLQPMSKGAEFRFDLVYHNLRPLELGALLSAITWHQTPNIFHKLGLGKPLGCGEISLEIIKHELKQDFNFYLDKFETAMNHFLGGETAQAQTWSKHPVIQELFALGSNQHELKQADFAYPKGGEAEENEFQNLKRGEEKLEKFSVLSGIKKIPIKTFSKGGQGGKDSFDKTWVERFLALKKRLESLRLKCEEKKLV